MSILTIQELQSHLSKITYRKGWEMKVYEGHTEGPHLEIKALLEDSVNKGEPVTVEIYSRIPPQISKEAFDLWLFDRLKVCEIHECAEWLQRDGKPIFNPHRENADRDLLNI